MSVCRSIQRWVVLPELVNQSRVHEGGEERLRSSCGFHNLFQMTNMAEELILVTFSLACKPGRKGLSLFVALRTFYF